MRQIAFPFAAALAALLAAPVFAHEPRILDATATKSGMSWRVDVTLEHPDTGWDHYADGWEVLDADGNRIGYRLLHHPHVKEQPFTRSLTNLDLPDGTRTIYIRANCSVDGWGDERVRVDLEP
ncbi:hypothetical protein [Roseovarius ramblicola]|uniref:Uncharacterized protein n=1 Tax=Roseovarius ramblicola TaxID=2022336 RepID=A0ABV5HW47_9RHOB